MLASTAPQSSRTRRFRNVWICCACMLVLLLFVANERSPRHGFWQHAHFRSHEGPAKDRLQQTPAVEVVVASQVKDNTTWLANEFSDWSKLVYTTDDPNAMWTVPRNKGREGMVYLTYIIDHYDRLPNIVIFSHANRYQWHNDDPLYDGQRVLSRLQLPYVEQQGYVNLRCVWTLGCPSEIRPHIEAEAAALTSDPTSSEARAGSFYKAAFEELFPEMPVPETVASACCAQFAVTAERIRQRPKSDYERFRKWLLQTELNNDLAGRIIEYSWHIMFGQEAVHCPSAEDCYCRLYGLCNLYCEEEGVCREYYTLPTITEFPPDWPEIDRDGQMRNLTQLQAEYESKYPL